MLSTIRIVTQKSGDARANPLRRIFARIIERESLKQRVNTQGV
jgi:hypothetical protein